MSDPTIVYLEELLISRCLPRLTIVFSHESPQPSAPHQELDRHNEEQKNIRSTHLNAAKVALLLAKAVSRRRADAESDAVLTSLRARDFCLTFQCRQPFQEKEQLAGHDAALRTDRGSVCVCDNDYHGLCTLLRVDIVPIGEQNVATESGEKEDRTTALSPMQNFGKILHAVFTSSNASRLLLTTAQAEGATVTDTEEEDEGVDIFERKLKSPKSRMRDASSLFSTLSNGGDCPIAVCRLLSDMIASDGDGEGGRNTSLSFDDVILDLEQMSNYPEIFLFDQGHEFYSTNLAFGQRMFGRAKELAQLLAISTAVEQSTCASSRSAAEAVFVSGIAGSGKSHFVQSVVEFLTNFGWIVVKAKFKRTMEHGSRDIVASLFKRLIARVVAMKSSDDEADADYSRRATEAISEALDPDSLSCLANFIPTIRQLIPGADCDASMLAEAEMSHWQLVFLVSELVSAILGLDRHVLIVMDDLQWSDSTTLGLIKEIIMSVGLDQKGRRQFLFIGMYRDDEVCQGHPLSEQLTALKNSSIVAVTEIKLSSLSTEDISEMIMSEIRLPQRLVRGLADVVHKKTSGHAMFVVQFLDSLVRESEIVYSPRNYRFDWDVNKIAGLRTWNSVANLIVSSLSYTKPKELLTLRILSCFGIQSELSLIRLIDTSSIVPPGGIGSSLASLLKRGILKNSDQSVMFTHDLIQQHLYDSIPEDERSALHLNIGIFLGSKTTLGACSEKLSIEDSLESLYFSDGSSQSSQSIQESTLVSIATDQINAAGQKFISDGTQLTKFAGWFLHAGKEAAACSNFQAALFNYKNGISFLPGGLWLGDSTDILCRELHNGAAFASFALGKSADVELYASAVIENVPLEDSLFAHACHIRSLRQAGKYKETIATGLAVLRLLSIDIPPVSSPMTIMEAMAKTTKLTSQYTSQQIISMKQTCMIARKRNVLEIVDAMFPVCYREASPYLPLLACAMINYSFQNGVCGESSAAFVVYACFQIFLREDFEEGRRWGGIAMEILDANSAFTPMVLHGFLNFWFTPHQEVANLLFKTYETGMKTGDVVNSMFALTLSMRFYLSGGMNLSLLSQMYSKYCKQIAKYDKECLVFAMVDLLLVEGLTGVNSHSFSVYGGMIESEDFLLAICKNKQDNEGIEHIYTRRFLSAFWSREYTEASKWLNLTSELTSSKMPKLQLIHRTFFSALLAFRRYRIGDGEDFLAQGQIMLEKMTLWSNNSQAIFKNKLFLLEAEHYACLGNIAASEESFKLAAESARDHGLVHEQGLAYELYGDFLFSFADLDALQWHQRAHTCYLQWGALAKAEQLRKEFNLELRESFSSSFNSSLSSTKHSRDEGEG